MGGAFFFESVVPNHKKKILRHPLLKKSNMLLNANNEKAELCLPSDVTCWNTLLDTCYQIARQLYEKVSTRVIPEGGPESKEKAESDKLLQTSLKMQLMSPNSLFNPRIEHTILVSFALNLNFVNTADEKTCNFLESLDPFCACVYLVPLVVQWPTLPETLRHKVVQFYIMAIHMEMSQHLGQIPVHLEVKDGVITVACSKVNRFSVHFHYALSSLGYKLHILCLFKQCLQNDEHPLHCNECLELNMNRINSLPSGKTKISKLYIETQLSTMQDVREKVINLQDRLNISNMSHSNLATHSLDEMTTSSYHKDMSDMYTELVKQLNKNYHL